ncbi:hypothetical protein LTR17_003005 [Elasticomyces elasticus]|nr:hypothetical protein LTR17_003005 [Elasticomyces elasticus]
MATLTQRPPPVHTASAASSAPQFTHHFQHGGVESQRPLPEYFPAQVYAQPYVYDTQYQAQNAYAARPSHISRAQHQRASVNNTPQPKPKQELGSVKEEPMSDDDNDSSSGSDTDSDNDLAPPWEHPDTLVKFGPTKSSHLSPARLASSFTQDFHAIPTTKGALWRVPISHCTTKYQIVACQVPAEMAFAQARKKIIGKWGCDAAAALPMEFHQSTPYSLTLYVQLSMLASRAPPNASGRFDAHQVFTQQWQKRISQLPPGRREFTTTAVSSKTAGTAVLGECRLVIEKKVRENIYGIMLADVTKAIEIIQRAKAKQKTKDKKAKQSAEQEDFQLMQIDERSARRLRRAALKKKMSKPKAQSKQPKKDNQEGKKTGKKSSKKGKKKGPKSMDGGPTSSGANTMPLGSHTRFQ